MLPRTIPRILASGFGSLIDPNLIVGHRIRRLVIWIVVVVYIVCRLRPLVGVNHPFGFGDVVGPTLVIATRAFNNVPAEPHWTPPSVRHPCPSKGRTRKTDSPTSMDPRQGRS